MISYMEMGQEHKSYGWKEGSKDRSEEIQDESETYLGDFKF